MSSYPYGSGKPSALAEELIKHPIILPALGFTSLLLVGLGIRSGRKRYPTARDIPPRVLRQHRPIRGVCTSVGDGDNFRVWHTPWMARLLQQRPPKGRKALKDQTIHVRIAGVDAPESANFGMPAQPFSAEAKAFLINMVEGKKVTIVPYSCDRYDRVVGMVFVPRWGLWKRNVSIEMIRNGFAVLYTAAGAEYGGIRGQLEALEKSAKRDRRGMWSQKKADIVSPREHKKQHLRGEEPKK